MYAWVVTVYKEILSLFGINIFFKGNIFRMKFPHKFSSYVC